MAAWGPVAPPLEVGQGEACGRGARLEVMKDTLQGLMEREAEQGRIWVDIDRHADHTGHRRAVIEWLVLTSEHFRLGAGTFSAALKLFDKVVKPIKLPKTALPLVAMACLSIAAKTEEAELNVPKRKELAARG